MAKSDIEAARPVEPASGPKLADLDRCVHCGLCLNACPTYRELGLEMDSPRGRIYQMKRVAEGEAPIDASYLAHIDLCLACRGCESACPSGVQYGRLIEAARAQIEDTVDRPWPTRLLRNFVFRFLLPSRRALEVTGAMLLLYRVSGLQRLLRATGLMNHLGRLGKAESLAPVAQFPSFYRYYGRTLAADGERRRRVAFLGGCIANISFARLNEATVRVLRRNGCDVTIPGGQTCCGALHVHAGVKDEAQRLARINIAALSGAGFDAIITNAAGCGSTLKEYGELLEDDPEWAEKARQFSAQVKDVTEFLHELGLDPRLGPLPITATYQDACHLRHGQKISEAPRALLRAIPELEYREMARSEICCGSAGIYNVVQQQMASALLETKMSDVEATGASVIAAANPGCMLQLAAGVRAKGKPMRVAHVVELLDEAYAKYAPHRQR
jgi:glycolate oxidase iron-sulfur subunit